MRVQVLQHVPFEDIGAMAPWLASRGVTPAYTRFYGDGLLPPVAGLDLVIVMGGPMSVNDKAQLPWLRAEKQFLREAIAHGVRVLGVCLGAQLIADALGARVYPNVEKEIGWFPIFGGSEDAAPGEACCRFPAESRVFHWHGETFDLPPGAVRLARSAACENQAFRIGRQVVGLQFHLETTPESAAAILDHCRDELVPAPWIQSEAAIRGVDAAVYAEANRLMGTILDDLVGSASP
ncbi:type 1 glutamine amidotransferase [Thiocapsa rosea]|uniref:GMP synthase-like glutamine amidotransferase n=1 Tax=Thiocapsa rosea TaxID=69360 RepID=A0A495V6A4_9GAMM|nr:type 1 glutamine amidotransferase [Thiocapsa rosea]RKT43328.1 GMP synthase-like glutamine amidotransferase [Thiocapsa rosea]